MQPSTVFPIGKARGDCESCGYAEIYAAAVGDPPELIVGDAHIRRAQAGELIRKLVSIGWMMYLHKVCFP